MSSRCFRRSPRAFTLIELLIVVAIIAILAAIAVPNFLEAQTRSKVARAQADTRSIATALEAYVVDNNRYMPWVTPIRGIQGSYQIFILTTPVAYMTSIPPDPFQASKPKLSTFAAKNYNPVLGPHYNYVAYSATAGWADTGWSVRSMGPDQDWDLVGLPQDQENPTCNGYYDPTNGTTSNGDLIRFGGNMTVHRS